MSIHLTQINVIVTTARVAKASTDSQLDLVYWANGHPDTTLLPNRWHTETLDNPWDDREWGRTDKYLLDFIWRQRETESQTLIPGIGFTSFVDVRNAHFFLRMRGDDKWSVSDYQLLGYFMETRPDLPLPQGFPSVIEHGWFLMSRHTRLLLPQNPAIFDLSTDPDEGTVWFELAINGTLGSEYVPPPPSFDIDLENPGDVLAPPES